ncbi:MAG: LL-diaminopimelate aminotransferase [Brevibacillus sp.]|nr:LL-diaminopimelate aminotransferase [Brevibacillus sp.]
MSRLQPARRVQMLSSAIFTEMARRKQEAARRLKVIDLGIGSPDTPPPPHLIEALTEAVQRPDVYGYPLSEGSPQFRQTVAEWYTYRFGVSLDPEREVHALMGSQDGLAHLALAWVNPEELVLVPDPGYPIYAGSVHLAGAELYPMPLRAENGYLPDLEAIPDEVRRRAKLMILNYPNNPVSAVAPLSFFEQVVHFARKHEIIVAHDLAYSEMAFDGYRPPSFLQVPGAKEIGIEFNSFSKSFNMAGCRVAYVVGSETIIQPLAQLKSNIDYGVFHAVQQMAAAALAADMTGAVPNQVSSLYQERRDVFLSSLNRIGWRIEPPKATMFVWAPVPAGWTSRQFAFHLLEKAGVVVIPGTAFGQEGEGYVRMALVQKTDELLEAVRRIEQSGVLGEAPPE